MYTTLQSMYTTCQDTYTFLEFLLQRPFKGSGSPSKIALIDSLLSFKSNQNQIKPYLLRINIPSPDTYIRDHMRFNPGIFHVYHDMLASSIRFGHKRINNGGHLHLLSKFGMNRLLL